MTANALPHSERLAREGDCWDRLGIPVRPGDLLRLPHFRDRTRSGRIVYMYRVVIRKGEWLWLANPHRLEPSAPQDYHQEAVLTNAVASQSEVIAGGHGEDGMFYERRREHESDSARP